MTGLFSVLQLATRFSIRHVVLVVLLEVYLLDEAQKQGPCTYGEMVNKAWNMV